MQVGDIIVVGGTSFVSKIIKRITGSKWTHVSIYLGKNRVLESDWNKRAQIGYSSYKTRENQEYVVLRSKNYLSYSQKRKILFSAYYHDKKRSDYDYLVILQLFLKVKFPKLKIPFLNKRKAFICTELVDDVLRYSNFDLFPNQEGDIFPEDFVQSKDLYIVEDHQKIAK